MQHLEVESLDVYQAALEFVVVADKMRPAERARIELHHFQHR